MASQRWRHDCENIGIVGVPFWQVWSSPTSDYDDARFARVSRLLQTADPDGCRAATNPLSEREDRCGFVEYLAR